MKNRFKKLVAYILTMVMLLTSVLPAQVMAENNFADIEGNEYQAILQKWIDNGYINGYPDGTFRPDAPITRAEFMALVNRALGLKEVKDINFFDVTPTDWFYPDVRKAFSHGYMSGADNKMFPNDNINRQEFAVVLARLGAFDTTVDETVLSILSDSDQIPNWSRGAISATLKANFFDGFITATNEFRPTQNVSRLEVVVVLERLLNEINTVIIDNEEIAQAAPTIPRRSSGGGGGGGGSGSSKSSAKAITSFVFVELVNGIINEAAGTIVVTVPYGTEVSNLSPRIGISSKATITPASGVAQDFTNPVEYTVTAENGSTKKYIVTVSIGKSNVTTLKSIAIDGVEIEEFTSNEHNYTIVLPYGTKTVPEVVGVPSDSKAAVEITSTPDGLPGTTTIKVTAENGMCDYYYVHFSVAKSSEKSITEFSFDKMLTSIIDEENQTISIVVPTGTDLSNLVATIVHTGVSVTPDTNVAGDFTNVVTYTVTAEDDTTKDYSIIVTVAGKGAVAGIVTEKRFNEIPLPIKGVEVTLIQGNTKFTRTTDKFGFYCFSNASEGDATLEFSKEGYVKAIKSFSVVVNKLTNINQTLTKEDTINTGSLVGIVRKGFEPLKNTLVSVKSGDEVIAQTTANCLGLYAFEKIPAGIYTVEFVLDDLIGENEVVIEDGKVTTLDYVFPGQTLRDILSGIVSFDIGGINCPLRAVRIIISNSEGDEVAVASTDTNGLYAFEDLDLPDGRYVIRFEKSGFEIAEQEFIVITGKLQQINQKLKALSKVVAGLVTNEKYLPLAGVKVTLGDKIEYTNEYGLFVMIDAPLGNGTLTFEKAGYVSGTKDVVVEVAKPAIVLYQMAMDDSTKITFSGKVATKINYALVLQTVLRMYPEALPDILDTIIPENIPGRDLIISIVSKLDTEEVIDKLDELGLMDGIIGSFNPQALINLIPNMPDELKDVLLKVVPSELTSNLPLPGTMITIKDEDGRLADFTIAGLDGGYELILPEGNYTLEFKAIGYETKTFTLSEVPGTVLLVPAPGKISGTITDLDGVPLEGATVTVVTADGKPQATTDENGKYTVTEVKPLLSGILGGMGIHRVEFKKSTKPKYLAVTSNVLLFAGRGEADKKLEIAPLMGNLTGKVKVKDLGIPVPGITVTVGDTGKTAITGLDGSYTINDIPVGTYTVSTNTFDLGVLKLVGQKVDAVIADDETTTQDLVMRQASSNAKLSEINTTIGTLSPEFTSGTKNYFVRLSETETGIPVVTAVAEDTNATVEVANIFTTEGTVTINVTAEDGTVATYTVVFQKVAAAGTLTGKVTANILEYSLPIGGVAVKVVGKENTTASTINGTYMIAGVPVGTYQVKADDLVINKDSIIAAIDASDLDSIVKAIAKAAVNALGSSIEFKLIGQTVDGVVVTEDGTTTQNFTMRTAAENANLSGITIDGNPLAGFAANKTSYTVELPYDATVAPTVAATLADVNATKVITQATSVTGAASIEVTAEDGKATKTYTVQFKLGPAPVYAAISTVVATNGTLTINLVDVPTTDPVSGDFTANMSINSSPASAIVLNSFAYDKTNARVTYSFTPVVAELDSQSVVITAKLGSTEVPAPAFTVDGTRVIASLQAVSVTNGTVTVSLDKVPNPALQASAVALTSTGVAVSNLSAGTVVDGKKVTYTFDSLATQEEDDQTISFTATYGSETMDGSYIVEAVPTKGSITGTVSPAGSHVTISGTAFTTVSDDDGEYEFTQVPAGIYDMIFSNEAGYDDETVEDIEVIAGQNTEIDSVTLELTEIIAELESVEANNDEGILTITLDKVPTNAPVATDFTIEATINSVTADLNFDDFDYDDEEGIVTFTFYIVEATSEDQEVEISVTYRGTTESDDFTVAAEEQLGTINGFAYTNLLSLAGTTVSIEGVDGTDYENEATTSVIGWYEFADIPAGTYDMTFTREGYETLEVENVVVEDGKTTLVTRKLSALGSLSGTITKGSNPTTIKIMDGTIEVKSVTVTSFFFGGGLYSINDIPVGIYTVIVTNNGKTITQNDVVINSGTNVLNLSF